MSFLFQTYPLKQYIASNIIADERDKWTYEMLIGQIGKLEEFFQDKQLPSAHCVGVYLHNNLQGVAVLIYLLNHRINFFLFTGHTSAGQHTPAFCDIILNIKDRPAPGETWVNILDIKENPLYKRVPGSFETGDGIVIFSSSGTTGALKYICYQGHTLLENAANCVSHFNHTNSKKIFVPVPVNHMYGLGAGLLPALLAGANICLADKGNVINILSQLTDFQPDITLLTPAICKMLLTLNKDIKSNGYYITAGERISADTFLQFQYRYGTLINLYGSTELGVIGTTPIPPLQEQSLPDIIETLPFVRVQIAAAEMSEILVKHNAGFEYYIDQTGMKQIPVLYADGWYPTRDVGENINGKYFTITGRVDHCVNRNGFLIPLQEIEIMVIDRLKAIKKVIVVETMEETVAGAALVAFMELNEDNAFTAEFAKDQCMTSMPRHLVPDKFCILSSLPVLSNGKPDRTFIAKNYTQLLK